MRWSSQMSIAFQVEKRAINLATSRGILKKVDSAVSAGLGKMAARVSREGAGAHTEAQAGRKTRRAQRTRREVKERRDDWNGGSKREPRSAERRGSPVRAQAGRKTRRAQRTQREVKEGRDDWNGGQARSPQRGLTRRHVTADRGTKARRKTRRAQRTRREVKGGRDDWNRGASAARRLAQGHGGKPRNTRMTRRKNKKVSRGDAESRRGLTQTYRGEPRKSHTKTQEAQGQGGKHEGRKGHEGKKGGRELAIAVASRCRGASLVA